MAEIYLNFPELDDSMLVHLIDLLPVLLEKQLGKNIECVPMAVIRMGWELTA